MRMVPTKDTNQDAQIKVIIAAPTLNAESMKATNREYETRGSRGHDPRDSGIKERDKGSGALRFQHPPVLVTEHSTSDVHNDVAQRKEHPRRQGLGKEVSEIIRAAHERDGQLEFFDFLSNKEVTTMDMFGARVVLRVVGQVYG
eukprot:5408171-Pleurochrysis_carterae.AAC.1